MDMFSPRLDSAPTPGGPGDEYTRMHAIQIVHYTTNSNAKYSRTALLHPQQCLLALLPLHDDSGLGLFIWYTRRKVKGERFVEENFFGSKNYSYSFCPSQLFTSCVKQMHVHFMCAPILRCISPLSSSVFCCLSFPCLTLLVGRLSEREHNIMLTRAY